MLPNTFTLSKAPHILLALDIDDTLIAKNGSHEMNGGAAVWRHHLTQLEGQLKAQFGAEAQVQIMLLTAKVGADETLDSALEALGPMLPLRYKDERGAIHQVSLKKNHGLDSYLYNSNKFEPTKASHTLIEVGPSDGESFHPIHYHDELMIILASGEEKSVKPSELLCSVQLIGASKRYAKREVEAYAQAKVLVMQQAVEFLGLEDPKYAMLIDDTYRNVQVCRDSNMSAVWAKHLDASTEAEKYPAAIKQLFNNIVLYAILAVKPSILGPRETTALFNALQEDCKQEDSAALSPGLKCLLDALTPSTPLFRSASSISLSELCADSLSLGGSESLPIAAIGSSLYAPFESARSGPSAADLSKMPPSELCGSPIVDASSTSSFSRPFVFLSFGSTSTLADERPESRSSGISVLPEEPAS